MTMPNLKVIAGKVSLPRKFWKPTRFIGETFIGEGPAQLAIDLYNIRVPVASTVINPTQELFALVR